MASDVARARRLEGLAVVAILLAALALRARDLAAPFDREFEGQQAALFAIGAANFERLGAGRTGGYPVFNVDLGPRGERERDLRGAPQAWYLYSNHPPLVPLLAWAVIRAGRANDWAEPCDRGLAPRGIEPWIRAPFLLACVLGLAALWWTVREAAGARTALFALALAAALPVSSVYGTLVNYEHPILLAILVASAACARWLKSGRARDLALSAVAFAAAGAVSYAGLFFVPPLAAQVFVRRGGRSAAAFAACAGAAALLTPALHAAWSGRTLAGLGLEPAPLMQRARELLSPLGSGVHPLHEWAALQLARTGAWFTWPVVAAAALGLAAAAAGAWRARAAGARETEPGRPLDLGPALLAGGTLYLLAFYRHTFDPQFTFLLLLVPGITWLAANWLELVLAPLGPKRAAAAGAGACAALALASFVRTEELRYDYRSAEGDARSDRPAPRIPLPDATGREIAELVPPGAFGIHPACVGLNTAVLFYAWRSLWAANGAADRSPEAVARRFGLGAAPHVLLLPKAPWPEIAVEISEFELQWVQGAPPDRESAHWRAWDLH